MTDEARAKIELVNLIRDLENKIADANRALASVRHMLSQVERITSPEPQTGGALSRIQLGTPPVMKSLPRS